MKRADSGRIVNISSGAGLGPSLTGIQAYCSTKNAMVGLTRQLAHELGPFGISVNSVAPGFVRSNAASERQWAGYRLRIQGLSGKGCSASISAARGGQAQRLATDLQMRCGLAQVEPRLVTLLGRTIDWDPVMRPQRRQSFPAPAIAMARGQLVAIEDPGDQFVIGDKSRL
jgi:NAD(P)-dependent dehydrogenase (short-subunit alcohol dehydrogenase family)